jgi:hypothetical protein
VLQWKQKINFEIYYGVSFKVGIRFYSFQTHSSLETVYFVLYLLDTQRQNACGNSSNGRKLQVEYEIAFKATRTYSIWDVDS